MMLVTRISAIKIKSMQQCLTYFHCSKDSIEGIFLAQLLICLLSHHNMNMEGDKYELWNEFCAVQGREWDDPWNFKFSL